MYIKKVYLLSIVALLTILSACSKWVDIQPSDRLSETQLFENQKGYLKALNGIYMGMADPVSYGEFLTAGATDAMGQLYMTSNTLSPFHVYMYYNYTSSQSKLGFENVWKKNYALIASLNVLIENCGTGPTAKLPDPYYGIIKGEALALRAFIHFDLLRLFGPIYSSSGKDLKAIPYYKVTDMQIVPISSSEEVVDEVTADLNSALELLKDSDPVIKDGVRNQDNPQGNNDLNYRQYRLNYYAAKALLARVMLWKGDRTKAGSLAREIITEVQQPGNERFPFVTSANAINVLSPDRIFATEVMFSIYTDARTNMYNNLFLASNPFHLSPNNNNADMTRVNNMYDDKNEYRYKIWEFTNVEGVPMVVNQKYKYYLSAPGNFMIPLIRLAELYLIVAECSDDHNEAVQYLNALRNKRNAIDVNPGTQAALKDIITAEYKREMIGEGQQFFYYKRNSFTQLPNPASLTGNKVMSLTDYVVPMPDSEISLRN